MKRAHISAREYKLGNRHTLCMRFGKGIACVGPSGRRNLPTIKGFPAFGWHKVIDNFVRQNMNDHFCYVAKFNKKYFNCAIVLLVVLHRKNYILKNWAEKITGTQQEYSPLNF